MGPFPSVQHFDTRKGLHWGGPHMTITRLSGAAALAFILGAALHARAAQVPGKGGDCAATWDTGTATVAAGASSNQPHTIVCEDGDPSCDTPTA